MDGEIWSYLAFATILVCFVLLFVGARRARGGVSFWGARSLFVGVNLMLIGGVTMALFALIAWAGEEGAYSSIILPIFFLSVSYLVILVGLLLYLIGFLSFCARWGATGRRRAELLEITTALTAANEQISTEGNLNPLSSETP